MAAEHRQPRFFLRGDDVERDPGFLAHAFDEAFAIGGAAAGFGRDRAGEMHIAPPELFRADMQRRTGSKCGRLVLAV